MILVQSCVSRQLELKTSSTDWSVSVYICYPTKKKKKFDHKDVAPKLKRFRKEKKAANGQNVVKTKNCNRCSICAAAEDFHPFLHRCQVLSSFFVCLFFLIL